MPSEDKLLKLTWTLAAWEDYEYWQSQDRKTLKRINTLIKDCLRHPFEGIGKPEPLKETLSGFWSRRIDDTHRLVYCVDAQALVVIACHHPLIALSPGACRVPIPWATNHRPNRYASSHSPR
ncbi:Txe/YoeB family addiction module toxin [Tepidiphilus margaritifer]|uniref:Txe/YoeB family addiction module toxin n=1 Tax=Tepidiphilus margaritifer TaxID=203471 RepID=UPI0003F77A7E|nr:Txe/YoeB family addiction module toxin [Tepidiphilus margaritifer]